MSINTDMHTGTGFLQKTHVILIYMRTARIPTTGKSCWNQSFENDVGGKKKLRLERSNSPSEQDLAQESTKETQPVLGFCVWQSSSLWAQAGIGSNTTKFTICCLHDFNLVYLAILYSNCCPDRHRVLLAWVHLRQASGSFRNVGWLLFHIRNNV